MDESERVGLMNSFELEVHSPENCFSLASLIHTTTGANSQTDVLFVLIFLKFSIPNRRWLPTVIVLAKDGICRRTCQCLPEGNSEKGLRFFP